MMLSTGPMRLRAAVLGLALLSSPAVQAAGPGAWISAKVRNIKPVREREARKAEALGHGDLAMRIRAGDLKSYKVGPGGVKIVGAGGSVEVQSFARTDVKVGGLVIPKGSRIAAVPTHRGLWYKAWTPNGRRINVAGNTEVQGLRDHLTRAVGEAP